MNIGAVKNLIVAAMSKSQGGRLFKKNSPKNEWIETDILYCMKKISAVNKNYKIKKECKLWPDLISETQNTP